MSLHPAGLDWDTLNAIGDHYGCTWPERMDLRAMLLSEPRRLDAWCREELAAIRAGQRGAAAAVPEPSHRSYPL